MPLNRRSFLGGGLVASLHVLARQARADDGPIVLEAGPAALNLGGPGPTAGLAYSGVSPGPLLRIRKGAALKLRLVNKLARPTTLFFPGLRLPNALLGVGGLTQPPVAPGASADILISPPDSGFNLYMPHAGRDSTAQIAQGLYGPVVVEEASPPPVDLDSVVVISDWRLDDKGASADLDDPKAARGPGRLGAVITAAGAPAPLALSAPPGARVRLRLANAATSRVMTLAIEGVKSLVIAVDGQPADAFEPLRNLVPLPPGARVELMFDLPREASAIAARLILRGGDAGPGTGEQDRALVVIEAKGEAVPPRGALVGLPANPALPAEIALERSRRIDMTITGGGDSDFAINGAKFADWAPKPLFQVAKGTPVTLGLVNQTRSALTMRLGGHVARSLHALDDGWAPYWRDTFLLLPGKTLHAAFVADQPGKWPLESASPERRDVGLAGWFQVV